MWGVREEWVKAEFGFKTIPDDYPVEPMAAFATAQTAQLTQERDDLKAKLERYEGSIPDDFKCECPHTKEYHVIGKPSGDILCVSLKCGCVNGIKQGD